MKSSRNPAVIASITALSIAFAIGIAGCAQHPAAMQSPGADSAAGPSTVEGRHVAAASMPDGATILAQASAGDNTVVLWRADEQTRIGAVLGDQDPGTNWEATQLAGSVEADGFTVRTGGQFTDVAGGGFFSMVGQTGADVTGIDVVNSAGDIVSAEVAGGYWAAAWMGDDFDAGDYASQTFVLHMDGGTSTTRQHPTD